MPSSRKIDCVGIVWANRLGCANSPPIAGPDKVRLSDLDPRFVLQCSTRNGIDYQPKPEPALPLSSHFRVSSSVQPGTAKCVGAVTRWTGRRWTLGILERCTVAALAEAHKVINRHKAKTDRIIFDPFSFIARATTSRVRTSRHGPKLSISQIGGIIGVCPSPRSRSQRGMLAHLLRRRACRHDLQDPSYPPQCLAPDASEQMHRPAGP
jgi:hypothetical protein